MDRENNFLILYLAIAAIIVLAGWRYSLGRFLTGFKNLHRNKFNINLSEEDGRGLMNYGQEGQEI